MRCTSSVHRPFRLEVFEDVFSGLFLLLVLAEAVVMDFSKTQRWSDKVSPTTDTDTDESEMTITPCKETKNR